MSLLTELQRRKVVRIGAAYPVVAWLAVQGASIGFPAFDAPPWALRVFIRIVLPGFPVAVVMARVFDVARDGVQADAGKPGSTRLFAAAGLLAALAFGWYFHGQPSFRSGDAATPAIADEASIAVRPFVNPSGEADEDYFADGMTEEPLNVPTRASQLKVVARTSGFEFKGRGGDVRRIGRTLGVACRVDGSVRREGRQVRVTAQLVRVADGFHVGSQDHDRELRGVFALQDDIAKRIGDALKVSLGVTPAAARASIDPQASDEYLKRRALLRGRTPMPAAIAHLRAVVARVPGFAAAWPSLSLACEVSFWYASRMTPAEQAAALAGEAEAAQRAVALEPGSAVTEHALGNVARSRFEYADAEQHYLRGMQVDPGCPDVREDHSELLYEVGRIRDSGRAARGLVTLDPYFVIGWNRALRDAIALDRRAEVEEGVRPLRAIAPDLSLGKFGRLDYALAHGRIDEARAAMAEVETRWPADAAVARPLLARATGFVPAAVKPELPEADA